MAVYNKVGIEEYLNIETFNKIIDKSITSISANDLKDVSDIGDYAFYQCLSLASITIPNNVTSIGHSAFYQCSSLTSITIPNSVTSIGGNAFDYCRNLTSVELPSTIISIGDAAFYDCDKLTSLTINALVPPELGIVVLQNTAIKSGTGYIYVPSESVELYKAASGWSDYASRIVAIQ